LAIGVFPSPKGVTCWPMAYFGAEFQDNQSPAGVPPHFTAQTLVPDKIGYQE
jgi:hypothetical protein